MPEVNERTIRALFLRDAESLICGSREKEYGPPVQSFRRTAEIFNALSGRNLTADEAALFMVALKLSRLRFDKKGRDTKVDAIGYLAIYMECLAEAK